MPQTGYVCVFAKPPLAAHRTPSASTPSQPGSSPSSASAPARPPRRPDDFLIRLGLRHLGSLHRRHLHDLVRDHESGCGHGTCDGPHSGSRSGSRSELSHQRDAVG